MVEVWFILCGCSAGCGGSWGNKAGPLPLTGFFSMGVRLVDGELHASLGSPVRALRKQRVGAGGCTRDGLRGGREVRATLGAQQSSGGRALRV